MLTQVGVEPESSMSQDVPKSHLVPFSVEAHSIMGHLYRPCLTEGPPSTSIIVIKWPNRKKFRGERPYFCLIPVYNPYFLGTSQWQELDIATHIHSQECRGKPGCGGARL